MLLLLPETAAIGHQTVRPIRLTRKGPTFLTGAAYISHKREVVPLAAGGKRLSENLLSKSPPALCNNPYKSLLHFSFPMSPTRNEEQSKLREGRAGDP